jgi:hypothetical protein
MPDVDNLQQKDLFTRRWRKVRGVDPREHAMQIALVQHLRYRARCNVVYAHCPNGEQRNPRTGAKLKAMGVLPGFADLMLFWPQDGKLQALFLELKVRGGRMSPEQEHFAAAIRSTGAHYHCVDSMDAALGLLKAFDLLKS